MAPWLRFATRRIPQQLAQKSTAAAPVVSAVPSRLQALRTRLAQEEEQGDAPPAIQQQRQSLVRSRTAPASDIREWLAALPTPPSQDSILTDQFHRKHSYLRLSLTERCNLRCTYCMPEEGVALSPQNDAYLSVPELLTLAETAAAVGVNKVRLTGGEPTLRGDLLQLMLGLGRIDRIESIGMTTNAVAMSSLEDWVEAGLSSLNISLDTVDAELYARMARRPAGTLKKVLRNIERAQLLPVNLKINCVVLRGVNDHLVPDMIRWAHANELTMRFIEYMPFDANGWQTDHYVPYRELLTPELQPLRVEDPHDTTKWFQYNGEEAKSYHSSRVGFITSMSHNFCAGCNRVRVTADGQLKVCLFDEKEVSLRDILRALPSPEEQRAGVHKVLYHALQGKHFRWGGRESPEELGRDRSSNRPMTTIGG